MDVFIIVLVIVIVIVFTVLAYAKSSNDAEDERHAREMARLRQQKEKDEQYANAINKLESQFGRTTIRIPLNGWRSNGSYSHQLNSYLYFFEKSSVAVIDGNPIDFKNILAYTLADNQHTIITTKGSADTTTSMGSMAGRALVGGALLGGVGALAGATTSKRDTEINTTTSHTTTHDYVIYLNIDDMANPQRILKFGQDAESANKAASVFNIIINKNKQRL